jgi:hypothetical protein
MKKWLMFMMLLGLIPFSWADEVRVEINPPRPVAGEVFQAYFRIFTQEGSEPQINFSPSNLEVVGKSNQGVSTRTVYANGRLTVTRELTVAYDLVAPKAGTSFLRDISVSIGGNNLRHPSVSVTVFKERQEPSPVFVMTEVPKKSVFLGEGIVVRYYIYSRGSVSNLDIKRYPKLNNFLKRFLQEPDRSERVSVDGQIYLRTQIYAAKLYPEKIGELKVDPLHLSATYAEPRMGDPFGAFGLSRDFKTKTFSSESVSVEVKPLPQAPAHFTGLVGIHDFSLQVGQSKLIVNEPLELKLTVSGVGALENFEAPVLIKHPSLEEFESNGDLKISDADRATKVFDYTFLAKENLKLPARTTTLSYFNPETEKFVATDLQIPEIVVAGGVTTSKQQQPSSEKAPIPPKENSPLQVESLKTLTGPVANLSFRWEGWIHYINLILAGLSALLAVGWIIQNKGFTLPQFKNNVPTSFRKGSFDTTQFIQWISPLIGQSGKSPSSIIKESPLSEEAKKYFIDLLNSCDSKTYSNQKLHWVFTYKSGHFKALGRYIESVINENSSKPS